MARDRRGLRPPRPRGGRGPAARDRAVRAGGFQALDFAAADLDADGRQDAVLILRRTDEDDVANGEAPRPLLLLLRQPDGRLAQARRTERLVYCRACGGMLGDPYQSLTAARGRFTSASREAPRLPIGPSSTRSRTTRAAKDWLLEEEKNAGDDLSDEPTGSDGEGDERSSWTKVLNRRSSETFRSSASTTTRSRGTGACAPNAPTSTSGPTLVQAADGLVVRGDRVEGFRELRDFVEARFTGPKGRSTYGYLLKKDLEPTGP